MNVKKIKAIVGLIVAFSAVYKAVTEAREAFAGGED